jgi:tripartite-type tricarboxylate transporter receptor subunit TctC
MQCMKRSEVLAFLGIVAATVVPITRASAAEIYAGKTVTILVGTDETSGFSLYSRTIAPYLSRYLPGTPTVIVRNMPGAGGSTAAMYMLQRAPRDGTIIATMPANAMMDRLFGRKVEVDPTLFGFIGGAERGTRLCVTASRSLVKTLDDAMKHKAIIGATAPGSPTSDYPNFLKRSTGAKFDIVYGYSGVGSLYYAMERGEIDGVCGVDWTALKAQKPDALRDKTMNIIVQFNEHPDSELQALGVPQPWSFIKDDVDRQAVLLMVNFQQAFGKAYIAPPQTPVDRLSILRSAFAEVMKDKQFLDDAEKQRLDIHSVEANEVEEAVVKLYRASAPTVERLKELSNDQAAR